MERGAHGTMEAHSMGRPMRAQPLGSETLRPRIRDGFVQLCVEVVEGLCYRGPDPGRCSERVQPTANMLSPERVGLERL